MSPTAKFALPLVLLTLLPAAARAQSGAFVVRLGRDTTSVERFTQQGARITLDQVSRAPRVLRRHASYTLTPRGTPTDVDMVVSRVGPADAPPVQHLTARLAGDSITIEVRADTNVRRATHALPAGAGVPIVSPWLMYDMLSVRLRKSNVDSLHLPMCFLGGPDVSWVALRRLGRDSVDIETEFDRYHARVDGNGHLLAVRPIRGTQQFSVDRVASLDLAAFATAFAAAEQQNGPLGQFSPRDTARATVAGATMWIDYGRPSRRGRTIFGGVVPWGEVWRTGANAATQFKTDKALAFGNTIVPAGFYTLWTLPTEQGWTLIINSETGQWGTEHKPERDLYKIPLSLERNDNPVERFLIHIADQGQGGQIHFAWDQTVAAATFTVQH
jgi:Protein of unknown function (DUF2911)